MNVPDLLKSLAQKRPIFHSEADFQHSLAWEIHLRSPDAKVRLEYRPAGFERTYVDLWVTEPDGAVTAIELKYKTRSCSFEFEGECHDLLDQSAQDQARYDFLRDVLRLEAMAKQHAKVQGVAVMLTNDASYWTLPKAATTSVDAAFRLHEGRQVNGRLQWGRGASAGTMSGREKPIVLNGSYAISWTDYSKLDVEKRGVFRYALVQVTPLGPARNK